MPFVLGWLLCLFQFLEKKQAWLIFVGGLLLGVGVHSYHAAKVMMPIYLITTWFAIYPEVKKSKRLVLLPLLGFVIPLLPLIPWLMQYPDTFVDQVKYTQLYDTRLGPFSGIATLLTPESILKRLNVFISYFDSYFLFFRGDASLIHSTGKTGVFMLAYIVLLPLGIVSVLRRKPSTVWKVVLAGFITAPVAAALVGDHYRISRALVILPFATLLIVYGVNFLLSRKNVLLRIICYLLLVTIPLQFGYFGYDYLTKYRIRSYEWFKYNIPGALEAVINIDQQESTTAIYLDNRIEFIDRYWKFYLLKYKEEELFKKTFYFDTRDIKPELLPQNSLLVYHFDHINGLIDSIGSFQKVQTIYEPDGTSRFYIFKN